jgi:hypothetical protein
MHRVIPAFFETLRRNKQAFFLFGLVLGVGIFARFFQLDQYFTHTDDLGILENIFDGQTRHDLFFLPRVLTNAPFQYLFTYFLVSPALDYRELLFWGRLPSCVAGCLALVALVFCYAKEDRKSLAKGFFAVVLVACSWENIAFAKQAHSYAIGILASAILLVSLMRRGPASFFSMKDACVTALALALASSMQYQVLLFVPAFYLALWVGQEKAPGKRSVLSRNLFLSAVFFLCLILPLWYFFLKTQYFDFSRKIEWAFGPAREYILDWNAPRNLWEQAVYAVRFFFGNLFVVFESKIAFLPETAPYFHFFTYALFGFFLLGTGTLLTSPGRRARSLGVFLGGTLLTWWGMAAFRQFPFGPSRHTLILLPLFAVATAEGAWVFLRFVTAPVQKKIPHLSPGRMLIGLGGIVLIFFAVHFREFLTERKNPVNENEIVQVLQAFDPDEIFYDIRGFHLEYIRDFREAYGKIKSKPVTEIKTFAFLTRYPSPSVHARCEEYQEVSRVTAWAKNGGKAPEVPSRAFLRPCRDFQVVYETKMESDVCEGFTRKLKTKNLANRFYFYVLSVDPGKKKLAPQFGGKA